MILRLLIWYSGATAICQELRLWLAFTTAPSCLQAGRQARLRAQFTPPLLPPHTAGRFNPNWFLLRRLGVFAHCTQPKDIRSNVSGKRCKKIKKIKRCVKRSECRAAGASYFLYSPPSITLLFGCCCYIIKEQIVCKFTSNRSTVLFHWPHSDI